MQGTLEFPYGLTDWWEAGHAKIAVNKLQLGKLSFHQTKVFASVECPHLTFWTFNQEILANPVILIDNNPREIILDAFRSEGLSPNIVFDAGDSGTMKRYVLSGLGIGIMGNDAFDTAEDLALSAIDLRGLIPETRIHIGVRRNISLNRNARHFIEIFAPALATAICEGSTLA